MPGSPTPQPVVNSNVDILAKGIKPSSRTDVAGVMDANCGWSMMKWHSAGAPAHVIAPSVSPPPARDSLDFGVLMYSQNYLLIDDTATNTFYKLSDGDGVWHELLISLQRVGAPATQV